ncbi:MAG TPA: hypothetical protein VGU69_11870 [Rhizomicrobium sp.]|nr:hypothetical protein [Rhizomicrobium sp.]
MAAGSVTALALSALFEICVPATSQGHLQQTFPTELIVPLTDREKIELADVIKDEDRAYHIRSDDGFILMTTTGGFCRILTESGDTDRAAEEFRRALKNAGGKEREPTQPPGPGMQEFYGLIPLGDGDAVAVVFTAQKGDHSGFFGSAFGVHKD